MKRNGVFGSESSYIVAASDGWFSTLIFSSATTYFHRYMEISSAIIQHHPFLSPFFSPIPFTRPTSQRDELEHRRRAQPPKKLTTLLRAELNQRSHGCTSDLASRSIRQTFPFFGSFRRTSHRSSDATRDASVLDSESFQGIATWYWRKRVGAEPWN